MEYTKPVVIAQNDSNGCYAAGCPEKGMYTDFECRRCFRTK